MSQTSAKIIADSVSPKGVRLTTFVCVFHRYILAEVNTHKDLSRNSASSRAIPSAKMIERVENNPALPIHFGTNQPGMQASQELPADIKQEIKKLWQDAAWKAASFAKVMKQLGLHKQVTNRLLEPFNWHTAIITTAKLDNFFWQRCDPAAQPEFKKLADCMQHAYYMGDPQPLKEGQWHLPFAGDIDTCSEIIDWIDKGITEKNAAFIEFYGSKENACLNFLKQVSVARCARVSYLNHDGSRELEKDFDLYDKLTHGMHFSPFEHQATPCTHTLAIKNLQAELDSTSFDDNLNTIQVSCKFNGNFGYGWHQLRKMIPNENRLNFIPNLPELADKAEILKTSGKLW